MVDYGLTPSEPFAIIILHHFDDVMPFINNAFLYYFSLGNQSCPEHSVLGALLKPRFKIKTNFS